MDKQLQTLGEAWEQGYFATPFYRDKLGSSQIKAPASYSRLEALPLTFKEEIRNTSPFHLTNTPPGQIYGIFSSSGTTGEMTYYIYSREDKETQARCSSELLGRLGIGPTDMGVVATPIGTGVMGHSMMWQFSALGAGFVNCPHPTPDSIVNLVTRLPVTAIATLPAVAASVLADPVFAQAVSQSSVNCLLMGGNYLSEGKRALLEQVWTADCYNMLGMSEIFGPIAGECPAKDGLHYLPHLLLIEVIDPVSKRRLGPEETGIAVYTTLWKKGFPLIRYWSDDFVSLDSKPCACGSSLPRLHFKGRSADCLQVGLGRWIFPSDVEDILLKHGFGGEFQVRRRAGELELLLETPVQKEKTGLRWELEALFDQRVRISLVPVSSLGLNQVKPQRFVDRG